MEHVTQVKESWKIGSTSNTFSNPTFHMMTAINMQVQLSFDCYMTK